MSCDDEGWGEFSPEEEKAMLEAYEERFEFESNYSLTEWEKSLYIIKLWICYMLNLGWRTSHGNYPETLCAVLIHHTKTYAGWEEEYIEVGHGLFKNWFYRHFSDSEWNM